MGAGWGLVWRGFCVGAGGVLSGWVLLWQGFLGGGFFMWAVGSCVETIWPIGNTSDTIPRSDNLICYKKLQFCEIWWIIKNELIMLNPFIEDSFIPSKDINPG